MKMILIQNMLCMGAVHFFLFSIKIEILLVSHVICDKIFPNRSALKYSDLPYATITLLISLKSRIPFGDETSNCNL